MSITTLCVDPDHIDEFWPHVRRYIESAFDRMYADDSAEIVLDELHLRKSLLWIAWDGEAILAAATTKLLKVTRGTVCVFSACGGRDMNPERWRGAIAPIEDYAKAEGCAAIRFEGRRGWQKMFPDYREAWVALEKRLT